MATDKSISSKERLDALKKKGDTLGVSAEEQARLLFLAEIMKQPSQFELDKMDEEIARKRQSIIQAGIIETQKRKNVEAEQAYCPHRRDDGKHLWSGQTLGPGNMYAKGFCVRCGKDYYWKSTPEQIANGLGLQENKGIQEINLQNEERNHPVEVEWLRKIGARAAAERHAGYLAAQQKAKEAIAV